MSDPLAFQVRAFNSDDDSENRIHADGGAGAFGFRGGLVPGVNVYGYLTVPLVRKFGFEWLDRGHAQVRFLAPFYHGDEVHVQAEEDRGTWHSSASVEGSIRARMTGGLESVHSSAEIHPELPLPERERRPVIAAELLEPGTVLGALRVALPAEQERVLGFQVDPNEVYRGANAAAHPTLLLGLINRLLTANFSMPAWIHTESELHTGSAARAAETVSVRGAITARYERKGQEFAVLDAVILGGDGRLCQQVRHTFIYKLRPR
jgi:acyl dehydratase